MKKTVVLIFATVLFISANAQVQFGVKGGVNLANVTVSSDLSSGGTASPSSLTSFNAGILASIPLFNSFTLQPEAVYSGQGAKETESGVSGTINYDYINVPVLFKYNHSSGLFAETGPQVGFLTAAKVSAQGASQDIKNETQSVDFSWAFGLGYKIPDINLGIDLRYNLGLTNVEKGTATGTAKNSVFQFGLFYLFNTGGN
jgi:hypothetical protein